MAKYHVTIVEPRSFPGPQRVRAGVTVNREHGYTGELTDEQLEEIKADSYLKAEEAKGQAVTAESPAQQVKPKAKRSK